MKHSSISPTYMHSERHIPRTKRARAASKVPPVSKRPLAGRGPRIKGALPYPPVPTSSTSRWAPWRITINTWKGWRLVPAQDGNVFYMRSHLSALQNCAILLSTNFQFIFIFKTFTTPFIHLILSCAVFVLNMFTAVF